jgi:hypothetical protein
MDRILIYYSHVINWAHGKRDDNQSKLDEKTKKIGFSSELKNEDRKIFDRFFKQATKINSSKKEDISEKELIIAIKNILLSISEGSFLSEKD